MIVVAVIGGGLVGVLNGVLVAVPVPILLAQGPAELEEHGRELRRRLNEIRVDRAKEYHGTRTFPRDSWAHCPTAESVCQHMAGVVRRDNESAQTSVIDVCGRTGRIA